MPVRWARNIRHLFMSIHFSGCLLETVASDRARPIDPSIIRPTSRIASTFSSYMSSDSSHVQVARSTRYVSSMPRVRSTASQNRANANHPPSQTNLSALVNYHSNERSLERSLNRRQKKTGKVARVRATHKDKRKGEKKERERKARDSPRATSARAATTVRIISPRAESRPRARARARPKGMRAQACVYVRATGAHRSRSDGDEAGGLQRWREREKEARPARACQ